MNKEKCQKICFLQTYSNSIRCRFFNSESLLPTKRRRSKNVILQLVWLLDFNFYRSNSKYIYIYICLNVAGSILFLGCVLSIFQMVVKTFLTTTMKGLSCRIFGPTPLRHFGMFILFCLICISTAAQKQQLQRP